MRCLLLFVMLVFVNTLTAQNSLSPEELKDDFKQFKEALKKRNKGLYLFISEEEFDAHLTSLESNFDHEMSSIEFMKLLRKAIIPVGERHLSISGFHKKSEMAKKSKGFQGDTLKVFPLSINYRNDSIAYIIRDARKDSSIHLPSQILSVNGRTMKDLRNEMADYVTEDYGVDSWKNWEISRRFTIFYYYNIDTTSNFNVEWVNESGNRVTDSIRGVILKQYNDSIKKQTKELYAVEHLKDTWRYSMYDSLKVGYLKIGTFSTKKMKNDQKETIKYKKIVNSFFNEVDDNNMNSIVIDLRNNTGGSVSLLKYLLSYIQPSNDKQVIYQRLKNRDWWFGEVVREEKMDKQRTPNFNGDIYVMTNGGSYSAAVMFPVLAKQFCGAKIVGSIAGGRPNGTTAGSFHNERLKHSDIIIRIPESVFTYTKDPMFNIVPDIELDSKIEDFFSYESDYALEQLLEFISNENRN